MRKLYGGQITCPRCKQLMVIDDIDFNFTGCQDEYYICVCGLSSFVKVRYGNVCKRLYFDERGVGYEIK